MDHEFPPRNDSHYEIEVLLPWYVTGQLDPAEVAVVEGHLSNCESCRTQLAEERELRDAVAALPFAGLPAVPAVGSRRPAARPAWTKLRQGIARPRVAGWFLSAQAATLLAAFLIFQPPGQTPPEYRTLSAAPRTEMGNVVIVFQPSVTEANFRHILQRAGAAIVDGPNAAGAYTLRVAPDKRTAQLKMLRSQPSVVLAEAVDVESKP